MTPEEDDRIDEALRASANGDKQAYAEVVKWCNQRLLGYCRSRLRFEDLRAGYQDDLLSQVLRNFWCELIELPATHKLTHLEAWIQLRRIAKSLACDHVRAENCQKRRPAEGIRNLDYEQHAPSVENEELTELEITEERDKFLKSLCERDRKILEMRRTGVDIETMTRELNVGTSTLYNRLRELELAVKSIFA